jgi:HPt (histidine-containing phosphotransfer) domain-containing protein
VNDFQQNFERLRGRFLERSAGDLREIEAALADLDGADRPKLRATVHGLAGAGGTFGFHRLSIIAGEADDALMELGGEVEPTLRALANELKTTLEAPRS